MPPCVADVDCALCRQFNKTNIIIIIIIITTECQHSRTSPAPCRQPGVHLSFARHRQQWLTYLLLLCRSFMLNEARLRWQYAVFSTVRCSSADVQRSTLGEYRPGRGDRDEEADVSASATAEAELLLRSATKRRWTGVSELRRPSTNAASWTDIVFRAGRTDCVTGLRTSSHQSSSGANSNYPCPPSAEAAPIYWQCLTMLPDSRVNTVCRRSTSSKPAAWRV